MKISVTLCLAIILGIQFGYSYGEEAEEFSPQQQETISNLVEAVGTTEDEMNMTMFDHWNLTKAVALEIQTQNITAEIFGTKNISFAQLKTIDVMIEGIRVVACDTHLLPDVECPALEREDECLFQIFGYLDGYAGLSCRTQCSVQSCSNVPAEELNKEVHGVVNDSLHTQLVTDGSSNDQTHGSVGNSLNSQSGNAPHSSQSSQSNTAPDAAQNSQSDTAQNSQSSNNQNNPENKGDNNAQANPSNNIPDQPTLGEDEQGQLNLEHEVQVLMVLPKIAMFVENRDGEFSLNYDALFAASNTEDGLTEDALLADAKR